MQHPACSTYQSSIPFYGQIAYHILFSHAPVDGHLGCFHFSAAVNRAALYLGVETPLWDPGFDSFVYIPRVLVLELAVILFLTFWRISTTFRSGYSILQSHEGRTGFPFLCIFTNTAVSCHFADGHSNWCEVGSHCSFDVCFPDDQWFRASFYMLWDFCLSSLEKYLSPSVIF